MKIDELQALIALSQYRSFSKAASKLNITQPGVSKRIHSLTNYVGQPLFERRGGGITLTGAGETLLSSAQEVVRALDQARGVAKSLSGELSGDLYLACSHHIGLHYLGPLLHTLRERHPQITLRCEFMDSDEVQISVQNGYSDIGLATLATHSSLAEEHVRNKTKPTNIDSASVKKLWIDPLQIVCTTQHALAKTAPTMAQLAQAPAILPASSTYTGKLIHEYFAAAKVSIRPYLEGNYVETIKSLIEANLGWGVIPGRMLSKNLVVLQPCNGDPFCIVRHLGIVYPNSAKDIERQLKPNVRAFETICVEHAAKQSL